MNTAVGMSQRICDVAIIEEFNRIYYNSPNTWGNTFYRSIPTQKCPLDLWVYQEIIFSLKPDVIIETGTFCGGSAMFMADILELAHKDREHHENSRVYTIDINPLLELHHHKIVQIVGDSASDRVFNKLADEIDQYEKVMVILDSDHSEAHVSKELDLYRNFVTPFQYLIVEDTNVNGNPVLPEFGPGPMEAVKKFLVQDPRFQLDRGREKFMCTFNPSGYLKRVK